MKSTVIFQLSVTQDSVTHYTYLVVLKTQGKTIVFSGLKKKLMGSLKSVLA